MASQETLHRLKGLVAEASALDPTEIRDQGKLRGYGIDSARVVDLVVGIEETFDVRLREEDLARIQTVSDLGDLIERLRAAS